ncbi:MULTISPECIES: chorismate lyase [unclassified Vibrio]|uniref:Probable chorismate pyruvate-lyase n=1 Tax=Vibrio sp. HB236076 TaxID=3232307 RepID=A0AB39HFA3_9VIBR|nr:chorismate lyase [Vibrio sp. HB161653]MDP5255735.1 chorismate lyase [Vibrio sp. HB161653]
MDSRFSRYFSILAQLEWHDEHNSLDCDPAIKAWLLDSRSLTHRLSLYCHHFRVSLIDQKERVCTQEMNVERDSPIALERNVILFGDDMPWVCAQTIIPSQTLMASGHNWAEQGETPIGATIFAASNSKRDQLQIASVTTEDGVLWARRSRLIMMDHPLYVTELFLSQAPIYSKENN